MWTKYLFFITIGIYLKLHIIFSDEDCQITQKPKLQIVFVIDQVMKLNYYDYAKLHTQSSEHLFDLLKQNNYKAEYAVVGFVDYPDTAGPRIITEPEHCYILFQELTTDREKMRAAVAKDIFPKNSTNATNFPDDHSQSLTTAMLFAAMDKSLKWNPTFYDNQNNIVRKIMIPMVYKDFTKVLTTPGNRQPPNADGTDNCSTTLIPEMEQLNQVLWDHQFTVINSIMKHTEIRHTIEEYYQEVFSSLFVPYYQDPLPEAGKYANTTKFDAPAYAKHLYDIIIKEVMSCDWEDPVGYITLGL